jgi:D-glucosaminate-6-phosphate ammonia-lyase
MSEMNDPRLKLNLRRIINAAGTMTALGASAAVPEAVRAAREILPVFVEIDDLQREVSRTIARATGAEAGFVTASSSAGITLAVAAAMTGSDLERIARLPDTAGMKSGIAIQRGHLIDYGAPIEQAIRLAGARVVAVGAMNSATSGDLEAALDDRSAAALYVVSHHTEQSGQIPLAEFATICQRRNVPLIVDAASEYDLTGFIAAGADIAIYSAHKFLGGLTAGIVAGKKALIRATYLQNGGIGRGMKIGKEGIASTIAALEAWSKRDHSAHRRSEEARIALWMDQLGRIAGLRLELSPDPTGNPITRLRLRVDASAGITAWDLADTLAEGDRPVIVRDDEIAHGYFELDPCNLSNGEAAEVAERIVAETRRAQAAARLPSTHTEWSAKRIAARLAWPDRAE